MSFLFNSLIEDLSHPSTLITLFLSFGGLGFLILLLILSRRFDFALRLEKFGIPSALLVGLIVLLLGPYGLIPLLPAEVTDLWVQLPAPLVTLVFATLMLGRPLPNAKGLWQPVAAQTLLGLLLGFGQYLVGGLVVIFFLIPRFEVTPLMGCLIEVGFEGGHGAASVMGESFRSLGFDGGKDLGYAMATVGLLASTLLGSCLLIIGRLFGWVTTSKSNATNSMSSRDKTLTLIDQVRSLLVNFLVVGCAICIAILGLYILHLFSPYVGDVSRQVINAFPVFPLALAGSFVMRFLLEKFDKTALIDNLLQREVGILATDLLITTSIASLNLPLLLNEWFSLFVLSSVGLLWNLIGMLIIGRYTLPNEWFERSLTEFGNATGVAASGLLLLRLADPLNLTRTLPIFSIKQLFLQPLLSGGLITVIAPILVTRFGIVTWTEISGFLTFVFIVLALSLQIFSNKELNLTTD